MDLPRQLSKVERWLGWSDGTMLRIEAPARPEYLRAFLDFVENACTAAALPEEVALALRLAAGEACSNIIAHSYRKDGAPGPLTLGFGHDAERVVLTIEDYGAPFDPGSVAAPGPDASAGERKIAGSGWHLIREVMDEGRYEQVASGGNRLTLVKHLHTHTRA